MLPGLEDLVIGKRISYGRPGLGRPWDEEGRGLAGGWQRVGRAGTLFGRAATDSHAQAIHCIASAGKNFVLTLEKKNE